MIGLGEQTEFDGLKTLNKKNNNLELILKDHPRSGRVEDQDEMDLQHAGTL
jgi:hypothetical protein